MAVHTLEKRGLDGFDDLTGAWDGKLPEFGRRHPNQLVERAVKAILAPESGFHRDGLNLFRHVVESLDHMKDSDAPAVLWNGGSVLALEIPPQ